MQGRVWGLGGREPSGRIALAINIGQLSRSVPPGPGERRTLSLGTWLCRGGHGGVFEKVGLRDKGQEQGQVRKMDRYRLFCGHPGPTPNRWQVEESGVPSRA